MAKNIVELMKQEIINRGNENEEKNNSFDIDEVSLFKEICKVLILGKNNL